MLKLMKYEFKKQMFSKLIMLLGIGLIEIYFCIAMIQNSESKTMGAMGILFGAAWLALFYSGIESITVFSKDLKTKQSYMLYMVPQTTYSILGAKIVAAILQILLTMVLFAGAFAINITAVYAKFRSFEQLSEMIQSMIETLFKIKVDVPYILSILVYLFFLWMMVILVGMFAVSLSTTLLANSKFRTPVSIVLFIVFVQVLSRVTYSLIPESVYAVNDWAQFLVCGAYLMIVSVIFYLGTAWMLDKKVCV